MSAGKALALLLLGFFCQASCNSSSSSKVQLYPSFQAYPNWKDSLAFPAATDGAWWLPTQPIIFYENEESSSLTLHVTVAGLPGKGAIKLNVRFGCLSTSHVKEQSMSNKITICETPTNVPIQILASDAQWTSDNSVASVELSISLLPDMLEVEYSLRLTQSLSFEFSGDSWNLVTNWVYLKRSKWVTSMHRAGIVAKEAKDFFISQSFSGTSGFDSKPLLISNILKNMFERVDRLLYTQVSFGVTLEPNTNLCRGSNGLPLMSEPFLFNHKWSIFKSFHIDLASGLIWYSRYGLRMGLQQFLSQFSQHRCPDKSPGTCVQIVGCSTFHNAQNNHNDPYLEPIFKTWYRTDATAMESGKRECFLPPKWTKQIYIFAGIQSRPVKCPIICSMADQQYGFFKNSEPMTRSNRQEFTRHGSVLVHQSGAFLLFGPNVTHEDSGQYMCSAEHLTATFEVSIIAPPRFSLPDTAMVGGELPPRIYFMDGDGYSVNCTVFFTTDHFAVWMQYKFHISTSRGHQRWVESNQTAFLETFSGAEVKETESSFRKSLELIVKKAPLLSQTFDFSHRLTCAAGLFNDGLISRSAPRYVVQSVSDALLVPRPSADDFVAKASPCCRDACEGQQKCRLEFSLKPTVHQHLKSLGLEVRARFVPKTTAEPQPGGPQTAAAWVREREQFRSSDSALLTWQMDEGLRQLHTDKRTLFASLLPVFFYHMTADRVGRPPKFSVHRSRVCDQLSASVCHSDPFCLFATVEESSLSLVLSVASQTGISQEYLDSLPPPPVEPATGRSNQTGAGGASDRWENVPENVKALLANIFNSAKNSGSDSAPRVWCAFLGLLMSALPNAIFNFIS